MLGLLSPKAKNLFFTSLAVTPSMLLEAIMVEGMDSLPSEGNQGSWVSLVLEREPSTLTVGCDVGSLVC